MFSIPMSIVIVVLCFFLLLLSIACRALHEYIRHDLERLCTRKGRTEYFNQIVEHYVSVRLGFEMIRSVFLFMIPILVVFEAMDVTAIQDIQAVDERFAKSPWEFVVNSIPYFLLFITCRYWVSRPIGNIFATEIVYYFFPFFRFVAFFALPLSKLAWFIEIVIHRLFGVTKTEQTEEENLEEDIRSIVAEGHRDGFIEDNVRSMLERIMRLDDSHVSSIMTQRSDMVCLQKDATWQEMLRSVKENQFSRIPIYGENRDDIVGILFIKDLMKDIGEDGRCAVDRWKKMLRKPIFVPETKQINTLLREFLDNQNHFAIVLDEYGNVSGLVTLEDILEQIVGEIADETDEKPIEEIRHLPDGSVEVFGRVNVVELNAQLGTEFPIDGDYETIGGLILTLLGHVPSVGEELEVSEMQLLVEKATPRKIEKVLIRRIKEKETDAE